MNLPKSTEERIAREAGEYATTHAVFTKELFGNIVADYTAGAKKEAERAERFRAALGKNLPYLKEHLLNRQIEYGSGFMGLRDAVEELGQALAEDAEGGKP